MKTIFKCPDCSSLDLEFAMKENQLTKDLTTLNPTETNTAFCNGCRKGVVVKPVYYDIVKIFSVYPQAVSEDLINWLETLKPDYSDNISDEHLYSILNLVEHPDKPEKLKEELDWLYDLASYRNDCNYFRIED